MLIRQEGSYTGFHSACGEGHLKIIKLLLDKGKIDSTIKTSDGSSGFLIACLHGHYEVVKYLLEKGDLDIHEGNNEGYTGFHFACQKNHHKIIKILLDRGMNIDILTNNGLSGLLIACFSNNKHVIKLLIEKGASLNYNDNVIVELCFQVACQEGFLERMLEYVRFIIGKKLLHYGFSLACQYGHINIVQSLIEKNEINIHNINDEGYTGFYLACQNGHVDIIKLLIDQGVNINAIKDLSINATNGNKGGSYLHLAVKKKIT